MEVSTEDLVTAYLRHLSRTPLPLPNSRETFLAYVSAVDTSMEVDDDFWAWELLTSLVQDDPDQAFHVLMQVIDRAPEALLFVVGAGPLEELIDTHFVSLADRIETELRANYKLRSAFRVVNLADVPSQFAGRFEAAASEPR
jgi:hypothetical protein